MASTVYETRQRIKGLLGGYLFSINTLIFKKRLVGNKKTINQNLLLRDVISVIVYYNYGVYRFCPVFILWVLVQASDIIGLLQWGLRIQARFIMSTNILRIFLNSKPF